MLAVSTVELGLRMGLSLAVVAVVGWLAARAARGRLGATGRRGELRVRSRQQLTRSAAVAVIQAGDRHFLVGVTDAGVSLLAEGDDLAPAGAASGDAGDPATGPEPSVAMIDLAPIPGEPAPAADGGTRRGAGKRHGGATGSAPTGMGVIEALRERTVRRA